MKKLLLICLSAVSISAFANIPEGLTSDWFIVGFTKDKRQLFYVNSKTIVRNGDVVRAWFAYIDNSLNESSKFIQEINCKTQQQRDVTFIAYKGTNFSVATSQNNKPTEWMYIVPDSVADGKKDIVCSYKTK